jgi:hypothetical protein
MESDNRINIFAKGAPINQAMLKQELTSGKLKISGRWHRVGLLAALIYLLCTALLGYQSVGLQYDEAILQHGAVSLLASPNEPTFAHDQGSWISIAGRHWPLMVLPYLGSVKDYLLVAPFALLGTNIILLRLFNALLAAFGIWGISKLLLQETNEKITTAVALTLAIHPAFLISTLYDNSGAAVWMASLGFVAVLLSKYKKNRTSFSAFCVGAAMGIATWHRANFLWFIAAAFIASVFVFRRKMLLPNRHWVAVIGGGILGLSPSLLYHILSKGAIFQFMKVWRDEGSFSTLLVNRLQLLSESLLITSENCEIWGEAALPLWQSLFFSLILLIALVACLLLKGGENITLMQWRRASALTFIFFAAFMLSSRLKISPHHFITLIPIAAVVISAAFENFAQRRKRAWILALLLALIYLGSAFYWNFTAARSFRKTGGLYSWSDGILSVNNYLQSHYQGYKINILDWGFQNNLYVLSNAQIRSRETFWGATKERDGLGVPWSKVVMTGGVFLTSAGSYRNFQEATSGFHTALTASGREYKRMEFYQKSGTLYAEIIELSPSPQNSNTENAEISSLSPKPKASGIGEITATPSIIKVCDDSGLGVTTLSWTSPAGTWAEVRVNAPDGTLFAAQGSQGKSITNKWVTNGMIFYLQDVTGKKPLTAENTMATVTVRVTSEGCP